MNEFLTSEERDRLYGSAEGFQKYYREEVLRYMVFDQTAVHKTIDNPPPMIYIIVGTTAKKEFSVVPFFLYDFKEKYFDKLHLLVQHYLSYNEKFAGIFNTNSNARVISVIGVCYAYMKVQEISDISDIKNLPESIKDDPQSQEVVILMSDFCEGELTSAMTIHPYGCKLVSVPEMAVITGTNRYHKALSGLFKRAAVYYHKN